MVTLLHCCINNHLFYDDIILEYTLFQYGVFIFLGVYVFPFFASLSLAPILLKRRRISVTVSILMYLNVMYLNVS